MASQTISHFVSLLIKNYNIFFEESGKSLNLVALKSSNLGIIILDKFLLT